MPGDGLRADSVPGAAAGGQRTLRIDLEYDGSDFEGWQRQATGRTVQGEVEAALARVLGRAHAVIGCGRTDAGVHASQHVASFRTTHEMPAGDLERALDALVPEDIGVLALRDMPPEFHAQRDALWKWYRYRILVSRRARPLRRRRTWRLGRVPPLAALQAASAALVGSNDFASFANTGSSPSSTVRTLHRLQWSAKGEELRMDAVGDGFLYKMVRTVVGTILQSAAGSDPEGAVQAILEARARPAAGPAAPALGLTLMAVAVRGEAPPVTVPDSLLPPVESSSAASGHDVPYAREGSP